jgi:hypothetical protein
MEELSMLKHVAQQQNRAFSSLSQEEISPRATGILDRSSHHGGPNPRGPIQRRQTEGAALDVPVRPATSPSINGDTGHVRPRTRLAFDDGSMDERRDEKRSLRLMELLRRAEERYVDFESLVSKAQATYKAVSALPQNFRQRKLIHCEVA